MKNIFKKIVVIIAVIMVLLSSCIQSKVLADEELPDYNGLPEGGKFEAITFTDWIVDKLSGMVDWFIGASTYAIKAVFLGWTSMIEKVITATVSIGTATDVEGSLTVEKIVSNKVPILDVNFFDFSTAGGRDLDSNSIVYLIRQSVAQFYYIIRNVTIGGLLVTLIYIGIRMAMASISSTKAKYKAMLIGWFESIVLVFFIHYIMVLIIAINGLFVDVICKTIGAEASLYDTIRNQSYAIQASIGWPATIIYIILIYLLIKFLFIYMKRFINVAILTFLAPIIAIGFSIDKIKDGKSQSFSKWLKDYTTNVLLQSVHCLLYFIFITLAFNVAGQSIYGVVLAIFLIMCMSQAEKIFKNIFAIESSGAPLGGMEDKPWTSLAATAKILKGAAKTNMKMIGKVSSPVTKPLGAGIGKIKSAFRNNKVDKVRAALEVAKATGASTISIKNSIFGRAQEYSVDQLLETGEEEGYSTLEMAGMLQDNIDAEEKEESAERKAGVKRGLNNAKAVIGMAMSIPMVGEGPITAMQYFKKNYNNLQIKGYKTGSGNYSGKISDDINNGIKEFVGTSGMALSIPVFAANPLLGTTLLLASARMRKNAITGFKEGTGSYTGPKGGIKTFAKDYANFNTLNIVPMIRQVKANMTAMKQDELTQRLIKQYNLSNDILQKKMDEEYQRLLNDPGTNKDELEKIINRAQHRVNISSVGAVQPPRGVTAKSIEDAVPIDFSVSRVRNSNGRMALTIKSDSDMDIVHLSSAMESYKERGVATVAQIDGYKLDSSKYASAYDAYKDFVTKGGTVTEQDVLDKFNQDNGTNYNSLGKLYNAQVENRKQQDLANGEHFMSKNKFDGLSAKEKEDLENEIASKDYIERIIESTTMESSTEINKKGMQDEFTKIAKETIAKWKGKKVEDLSTKEFTRMLGMMSSEQIEDILGVVGTRNSAVLTGTVPSEYNRLLSLMQKAKYNDHVVNQISYDRTQAANVAQKIKNNRKRGVK